MKVDHEKPFTFTKSYTRPQEREGSPFKNTPERKYVYKGGGAIEVATPSTHDKTDKKKEKRYPYYAKEYKRIRRSKTPNRKLNFTPRLSKNSKKSKQSIIRGSPSPSKKASMRSFKISFDNGNRRKPNEAGNSPSKDQSMDSRASRLSSRSRIDKSDGQVDAILQFYK